MNGIWNNERGDFMKKTLMIAVAALVLAGCEAERDSDLDVSTEVTTREELNEGKDAIDNSAERAKKRAEAEAVAEKAEIDAEAKAAKAQLEADRVEEEAKAEAARKAERALDRVDD